MRSKQLGGLTLLVLSVTVSGCAFGTNRVQLAAVPAAAMPASGAPMRVQVRDARAELSGATVGFKRNGYGAKTGDVALANGQALSERVQGDLVTVLRERGYRASSDENAPTLRCDAEILSFVVDDKQGFWSGSLEGIAAMRIAVVEEASGRQVLADVVRGSYEKTGLQFVTEGDHQEVVAKLYESLLTNLRAAVPDARAAIAPAATATAP